MSEKGNGMQRAITLALLQVYAQKLASHPENKKPKPFYLFIDEPELCLHPKGQTKLLNALLEISKNQQIFLTTHSPYFLSTPHLKDIGVFIFKKDGIKNKVSDVNTDKLFDWSPTWGEINFNAYNLATVDFHNELYGYLQNLSHKFSEKEFENWLTTKNFKQMKQWIREHNGQIKDPQNVTLQTYIRNSIHHPENRHNQEYTEDELSKSIQEMVRLIEQEKTS